MTSPDEPFVTPIESAVTDVPESLLDELKEILQRDVEQVVKITDVTREASRRHLSSQRLNQNPHHQSL